MKRLVLAVVMGTTALYAHANDKLIELSQSNSNWVLPGKDYSATNYSPMDQINKENVADLRPSWTFSTGVLNGHEGTPLVVDGVMYIHTPFPNNTYAVSLDERRILWSQACQLRQLGGVL